MTASIHDVICTTTSAHSVLQYVCLPRINEWYNWGYDIHLCQIVPGRPLMNTAVILWYIYMNTLMFNVTRDDSSGIGFMFGVPIIKSTDKRHISSSVIWCWTCLWHVSLTQWFLVSSNILRRYYIYFYFQYGSFVTSLSSSASIPNYGILNWVIQSFQTSINRPSHSVDPLFWLTSIHHE